MKASEWDIQRAFTIFYKGERWAKGPNKGQWKVEPAGLPGVVSWHTPNGGKRDRVEAIRFKMIGVEAGIPDYFFLWGGLYGLEFKDDDGSLSRAQLDMHPQLRAAGMIALETVDNLADGQGFRAQARFAYPRTLTYNV
jgi:hypothetical protein